MLRDMVSGFRGNYKGFAGGEGLEWLHGVIRRNIYRS